MELKPGTWLGHYEILGHLGSGGMGEVYRARDNKLQREVALKVLPQAFAQDPERVARFRREAQVLAQVNHPNIAAIYSVEQTGDTHFLVMELVPGETLRDRIKWVQASRPVQQEPRQAGMPVPLDEALDIAKQIAAGLEAAHEKPIVHRDLKPANVKVTPEGVVKILDFGLARAFSGDSASSDPSNSPTLSAMTAPGIILGTAAYMSPEQARGKMVDKRTDIWALGCVLYEMLTGKHAFDGEDVPEILASVMKGEPDWSALPATTPPNVRFVLQRCLEKDPRRRLRDAADLQIQLEETQAVSATAASQTAPAVSPPTAWRRAVPWAAAFAFGLVVAGLGVWSFMRSSSPAPQPVARFAVTLPPDQQFVTNLSRSRVSMVVLSPDGTHLVYVANGQLYLRPIGELESTPIRGTQGGAGEPFFSPDGQWVGFETPEGLKKVSITGGAPVTLAEIGPLSGATWGTDDIITFGQPDGIWQVPGSGGTKQLLVKDDDGVYRPEILPGGKAVLFTRRVARDWNASRIVVRELETGEQHVLVEGGADGRYVPTGHVAYLRDGTLFAARLT